jgi:ABC-type sugar transport system substrate-binding protein
MTVCRKEDGAGLVAGKPAKNANWRWVAKEERFKMSKNRPPRSMKARWLPLLLAVVGLLAVVVGGCGSSSDSSSGTESTAATNEQSGSEPASFDLGWMVLSSQSEFFVRQEEEVEEILSTLGGTSTFMDAKESPTVQLQLAQTLLNNHQIDALAGTMQDPIAFQPVLEQASEEKVPVAILGIPPAGEVLPGQTVITSDFVKWGEVGGEAMGKCVNERFDGKAEVALLNGPNIPGPAVKGREKGLKDGLAKTAPETEVSAEAPAFNNRLKGLQAMQTILQAHPDIQGAMAPDDEELLGALQAFKAAGKNPSELCIIGMDSTPEGVEVFEKGEFYSEVDINLKEIYEETVNAAVALLKDIEDPKYSGKVIFTDTYEPLYQP